jgi:4-amino-4-deoxy-L-arabinose transferase-like glycosyltransferase
MVARLRAVLPFVLIVVGIVVLGAALRFYAIDFGMAYPRARPDEGTAIGHAVDILAGDPNPHFFNWPSFTLYVFAAAFALAKAAGVALTGPHHVLIARSVVALAGTATVLVTMAIGRSLVDRVTGACAALFLAVAPLHVRDSHFAMTDVLMTLIVALSVALTMRGVETRRRGLFAAAGVAGGLATSTKYSAGAILAVAAAAPAIVSAAIFVAGWAAGFLAATPFAVLDFPTFSGDVSYERAHLSGGHTVLLGRGWLYHLHTTLPHGLGLAVFAAAVCGIPIVAVRYRTRALVPAIFAAAFYLSIGAGRTVFFRYAIPLLPVACVLAAAAVRAAAEWLSRRTAIQASSIAGLLALAVAAPSLWQSVQLDRLLARQDARALAAEWLSRQLHPDHTLHDSGGDYTRLYLPGIAFHEWRFDPATRSFGDPAGATPDWIVLYESPLPEYTAASDALRDLVRERYALAYRVDGVPAATGDGVYDRQDAFFAPIAGFTGVARPGPTVLIYKRRI